MARISTRIKNLEAKASSDSDIDYRAMLVTTLARRDALHFPWRTDKKFNLPVIRRWQKEDIAGKRGVSARASGRSDWKTSMETRNALVTAKLCTAKLSRGGEVSGLVLTPQGEADARALVGSRLFSLNDALPQLIFHYLKIRKETTKGTMIESLLWQRTLAGYSDEWDHLLEPLLPLLTAGLISCDRDVPGRLYFAIKAESLPEPVTSNEQASDEFDEIYIEAYKDERNRLEATERSDEIYIPIPCGVGLEMFKDPSEDPEYELKREAIEKLEQVLRNYGQYTPSKVATKAAVAEPDDIETLTDDEDE